MREWFYLFKTPCLLLTPHRYKGERFVSIGEFPKFEDALKRKYVSEPWSCETTVNRNGPRMGEAGEDEVSEGFEDVARWEREKVGGHSSKRKHILSTSFPGSIWENVLIQNRDQVWGLGYGPLFVRG